MFGFILFLLVIGLIGGFVARAVVPGKDSMSVVGTIFLGTVGSFIGGFICYVIAGGKADSASSFRPAGIIGSILGSIVALIVYRMANGRRMTGR
jgi:uncharacterized membrane protein YeaQ/YmgE (transglycosylase-associated protein family)